MTRKGIILSGGSGTRLHPLTLVVSKQLLPVYDKPMIYYPVSTLMRAGIRDMAVITTPDDLPLYKRLLGTGEKFGVTFTYIMQPSPDGLAQALILAEDFLAGADSAMALGDNLFFGDDLESAMARAGARPRGATVFGALVNDPERYGVIEFDSDNRVRRIVEKPQQPPSSYAVTGLYFYDGRASALARQVKPSRRNELEITDLNNLYLEDSSLHVELLGENFVWLDAGTHASLLEAGEFVRAMEKRSSSRVGCIEEIAFRQGWIDAAQLRSIADGCRKSPYGKHLAALAEEP